MDRRLVGIGLLLALLLGAGLSSARAQRGGITVTIERIGYEGHGRDLAFVPVTVLVENAGADARGYLEIGGPGRDEAASRQQLDLPGGAVKRVVLPLRVDLNEASLRAEFVGEDGAITGSALARYTTHDRSAAMLAVVGGDPTLLSGITIDGKPTTVVHLDAAGLPASDGELLNFSAVALVDAPLTPEQAGALRRWAGAGGVLLVDGGPSSKVEPGELAPLLPAAGAADAGVGRPVESGEMLVRGRRLVLRAPALATRPLTLAAGASVLARAQETPLIAERRLGAGRVLVSAFDLAAMEGEPAKADIWRAVFGSPRQMSWDFTIQNQAQANAGIGLPSISMLAGLLFGYVLVVGPLNFLVLRRLDRREWAWVSIPLSVLLFTTVAYGAGSGLRQVSAQLIEVSVVEGAPGAADGRLVSAAGFLAGQRGSWTLRLPKGVVAGRATWDRFSGGASNPVSVEAEGLALRDQAANVGETREVMAAGAAPLPFQIEAALASDPTQVTFPFSGSVTLAGGELPEQAFLVYGESFLRLEGLEPGVAWRLPRGHGEFGFPYSMPGLKDEERNSLSNMFSTRDDNGNLLSPGPMLVALRREQALNAVLEGGTSASGLTVYVIHLPTEEQ